MVNCLLSTWFALATARASLRRWGGMFALVLWAFGQGLMAQPACDISTCVGHGLTFTPVATNGTSYAWTFGDGGTSSQQTPTYAYSSAGSYSVGLQLTDGNGCVTTSNQWVCVYPAPIASVTSVNPLCAGVNNGVIDLTVSGGAPGTTFLYNWSTGQTTQDLGGLAAGTYAVTVTDGITGCTQSVGVTLSNQLLDNYAITASGPTTFCQGESVLLSAGTGFASYLWSTGATSASINVTASGTYSVTVTNAQGCQVSASQVVTVNPLPVVSITQTPNSCTGVNVTLTATPGYASYSWNQGLGTGNPKTVTSNGNYRVTVTNSFGCTQTASTLVNPSNSCLTPTGLYVTAINVPNATLNWTPAPCNISYQIQYRLAGTNPPGTTVIVAAPATSVQIGGLLANSTYEWRIQANCGPSPNSSWSGYHQFSTGNAKTIGSSAEAAVPEPTLFPNPNDGKFTVIYHSLDDAPVEVCVWDMHGKLVYCAEKVVQAGENTWEMNFNLAAGVYFCRIEPLTQGRSEPKRIRFVVE